MTDGLARGVDHEICDRHFATRNESGQARKQTERDQESAHELDDPCNKEKTLGAAVSRSRETEKFLTAMTCIDQPDNQSHNAINRIRKSIERVHGRLG